METKIEKFMFYDLYWSLIKSESNKTAGRFAKRICAAMFTDSELPRIEDKEEAFVWSNIEDILKRSKEAERNGGTTKTLNRQMRHFAFLETYYRAIDLMNEEQSGAYLKALCMYMFENAEPPKLLSPVDKYFSLAKLKLSLSKVRSNAAKSDGKPAKTVAKERAQEVMQTETAKEIEPLSFEKFMELHPTLKDDLYPNSRGMLRSVDWAKVNDIIGQDSRLSQNRSLYWLMQDERIKAIIKNG